VTIIHLQSDY